MFSEATAFNMTYLFCIYTKIYLDCLVLRDSFVLGCACANLRKSLLPEMGGIIYCVSRPYVYLPGLLGI